MSSQPLPVQHHPLHKSTVVPYQRHKRVHRTPSHTTDCTGSSAPQRRHRRCTQARPSCPRCTYSCPGCTRRRSAKEPRRSGRAGRGR
ncbi:hypothetical protein BC830DRAFT_1140972 [Chytriomyces sp. MP71]|nr:hypothetical protein BC830DRAFT_1140972 [Chytriomyces sp. MP71]